MIFIIKHNLIFLINFKMEDVTPTFCKDHLPTKEKDSYNFSIACEGIAKTKPKGKYSCSNVNLKVKSVNKYKKEKSKNKIPLKKRHHSQKFDLKNVEKALDWGKDSNGREDKLEKANEKDGRGDWCWTLTVIDEKTAVLNGAGSSEGITKWYNLK